MKLLRNSALRMGLVAMGLYLTSAGIALGNEQDEQVFNHALSSTVFVVSPISGDQVEVGSGALVNVDNRTAVTAWHVVENRTKVLVFFPTHDETGALITDPTYYRTHIKQLGIEGTVIAADSKRDVAVIQLAYVPPTATAMPLADHDASTAETVHAIGNSGIDDGTLWRYSDGKVRSVYLKNINYKHDDGSIQHVNAKVVETQCPTNQGDSGGPIVNDKGELVAIVTGSDTKETNVEYGIGVSEVKEVLDRALLNPVAAIQPPTDMDVPVDSNFPADSNPPTDAPPAAPVLAAGNPAARITSIRSVSNVVRNGERGVEIHVNMDLDNALGVPCDVEAIFANPAGQALPATNGLFTTPDGRFLSTSIQVVAKYPNAKFTEVVLFMPYSALTIGDGATIGQHNYTIFIDVFNTVTRGYITQTPGQTTFTLNVHE